MAASPTARRSTETRSAREIGARLAFIVYLLALPVGLVAIGVGLTRHSSTAVSGGVSALLVFGLIHVFARRALGFAAVLAELKRNPFKPKRTAAPGTAPAKDAPGGCDGGSCGSL